METSAAGDTAASASDPSGRHFPAPSPRPPLKSSSGEALFRLLCPASASEALIGRGGSALRHLCDLTGARIHIDEPLPAAPDDCLVHVIADRARPGPNSELSAAQQALIKVFERSLGVEEERAGGEESEVKGAVGCRLLVPGSQVGCVLGKGGKIVEKIRQESGAQIRVLSGEKVPPCASPGEELILILGTFSAVKKALLSVSGCLQDNPRTETTNLTSTKPFGAMFRGAGSLPPVDPYGQPPRGYIPSLHVSDHHFKSYSPNPGIDTVASGHRMVQEEELIFRMLCTHDKVGSIIGRAGQIVRTLQSETGAIIKILDAVADSDERVIVVSARENADYNVSPAQEAVLRINTRLADPGVEKGAVPPARLLVPAQQIGCLLGKGGTIINEMRRATGANIRIFMKDQVPKCAQPNDEVVQVTGSFQSVQDALHHITSRIRESIFGFTLHPNTAPTQYMPVTPKIPGGTLRLRPDSTSPGSYSSVTLPHGPDRSIGRTHGVDQPVPVGPDRVSFSYGSETTGPPTTFDHHTSPRSWVPQAGSSGTPRNVFDAGTGMGYRSDAVGSGIQAPATTSTTIEIVVPHHLLRFIYGENGHSLMEIEEISGSKVTINDPKAGATEGTVIISGAPNQTRAAQCLLHAFIQCGKAASQK